MTRPLLFVLTVGALLIVAVTAQTGSPTTSEQATNFWTLTVAGAVLDLHNPRTLTLCKDPYADEIGFSVDGKHWHRADVGAGCGQVPPVRFVRLEKAGTDNPDLEVYATY
jgi:hypothetical protein